MFSCYFIVFQEKTSVREGVPSQTLKGGRMKKSYPGIKAKHIKCSSKETIRLQNMDDKEMRELLHQDK